MKTVAVAFEAPPPARALITATVGGLGRAWFLGDPGFLEALPNAEILLVRGWRKEFPPGTLAGMRRVEVMQCLFTGVEHLPWEEIPPSAIVCTNAGAQAEAVAEHAMALLLAAAKRVPEHDAAMRLGGFHQDWVGRRLAGMTLGILGHGEIGRHVARMAKGFSMRVLALNRRGAGREHVDVALGPDGLDRLRRECDVLVCCLPLTKHTAGMIDGPFLAALKEDAILVNISRGKVVDEAALYAHLRSHPAFIAALDVWWRYPKQEKERPFEHPFHELPNVVMTPHVAFAVPDNGPRILAHAMENVLRHLRGEALENVADSRDYR